MKYPGNLYSVIETIKEMIISGSVNRLILEKPLTKVFTPNETKLCRSTATFGDGFVTGENAVFTTRPFIFDYVINRAHMTVKHQNVPDTEITAEMSIQHDAEFINGEIIGIGDGTEQTVTLANTVTRDAKESITISSEAVPCRTH